MSRGHDRERAVRRLLEDDGWWVARAAGSLGDADLVASRPLTGGPGAQVWLVEVKSTAGGPYERFGPAERLRLAQAAERAGGQAMLCWWPPRGRPQWIPSSEWPGTSLSAHTSEAA